MSVIKHFFKYSFKPTLNILSNENLTIKQKPIRSLLILFLLTVLFNGILFVGTNLLIDFGITPDLPFKDHNYNISFTFWAIIVIVISPILEEIAFRGILAPSNFISLVSFSVFVYYVFSLIVPFNLYIPLIFLLLPVLTFFLLFALNFRFHISIYLNKLLNKHFSKVYYISILVFVLFHYNKYQITPTNIYWLPLFFFPYLVLGFVFSYIRISLNLTYAIVFHIFYNAVPFLISLTFML
jgi:hypothetical protein